MYNEEKGFSLKNVLIKIILIILFVFLLLWFFPMPKMEPIYDRIFYSNIETMKDAAKDYYTTERLPEKVGDVKKLTLKEMIKLKLVLPFYDSKNKACDVEKSYVEITKLDTEYTMKINLKCSNTEEYIIVHMGCYDYCKTTICEAKPVVTPKPVPKPEPKPVVSYLYEYKKVIPGYYSDWSNWSAWSVNVETANNLKEVQTKTETTYKDVTKLVAYKTTTYSEPVYKQVTEYSNSITTKTCNDFGVEYDETGTYKYTEWTYSRTVNLTYTPKDTDTTKYVYIEGSSGDFTCSSNCTSINAASYKVYTRTKLPVTTGTVTCTNWSTKKTDLYIIMETYVGSITKSKTEPVYGIVKEPVYTKYYSYRTRTFKEGITIYKWSYQGDKTLLNNGYIYTGNKKVK